MWKPTGGYQNIWPGTTTIVGAIRAVVYARGRVGNRVEQVFSFFRNRIADRSERGGYPLRSPRVP